MKAEKGLDALLLLAILRSLSQKKKMRLDLYISLSLGVRLQKARGFIREGTVKVDERVISHPDWQVFLNFERVEVGGQTLRQLPHRMMVMNKPQGVITESGLRSACPQPCVTDLLPEAMRKPLPAIFGRLDKDTSGLLLFGTDGGITTALMHPAKHVSKTYLVTTKRPLGAQSEDLLREGVTLQDGTKCLPATLLRLPGDPLTYRITIQEGMYHQVIVLVSSTLRLQNKRLFFFV